MSYQCSRPFYEMIVQAISNPDALWNSLFCPFTITGLGLAGVGLLIIATGFVGLRNWSESWTLPLTWLAFTGPVMASAMLPGNVIRQIAGGLTLAVAMLIIGLWYWWSRA